jgi:glycosyl transferase family 87
LTIRADWRLAVLAVPTALVALTSVLSERPAIFVWKLFGVPALFPRFADTRVITTGWDCARQGIDVLKSNPCDAPWFRPVNYPRLWLLPGRLGLGASSTKYIAVLMIAAFLVAAYFVMGPINTKTAVLYLVVFASMPVLLLIERGNNDLLVFALLVAAAAALTWLDRAGAGIASGLIVLATALKLYPIAAAYALFVGLRGRRRWWVAAVLVVGALYALVTRQDLALIQASTPRPASLGYGLNVLVQAMADEANRSLGTHVARSVEVAAIALVLLVLIAATWLMARALPPRRLSGAPPRETFAGLLFSVGAAVYVLTFLLGNDWVYRLTFLLLAVPQLLLWRKRPELAREATGVLIAVVASLWLAVVTAYPVFFVGQLLLYGLFVYFASVLLLTAVDELDRNWAARMRYLLTRQ